MEKPSSVLELSLPYASLRFKIRLVLPVLTYLKDIEQKEFEDEFSVLDFERYS